MSQTRLYENSPYSLLPDPGAFVFDRRTLSIDGLGKRLLDRHPGEPRIMSGAGTGVQNVLK
jgi:hypothetical protein